MSIQAGTVYQQQPTTRQQAAPGEWYIAGYFFDAWLRLNHNTSLTVTQHPVETGAAITDHAYNNMRRFSFDIGITNALAQPVFVGNAQRDINAYNLLVKLQTDRVPFEIATKYGVFQNCLIESIDVSDDFESQDKMIATVNIVQIIFANAQQIKVSINPQATDQTNRGNVPARPPLGTEERKNDDLNRLKEDFRKIFD